MLPLGIFKVHLENLRGDKAPIRVHGNGFIQIDVDNRTRINVWSPLIPAQKVYTGIHDHRFNFVSTIWYGTLYNRVYKPIIVSKPKKPVETEFQVFEALPTLRFDGDEDTKLTATDSWIVGGMNPSTETHVQGQAYYLPRYEFHESVVKRFAVTCMTRFSVDTIHKPRVLVKIGETPSNEFDKHGLDTNSIWEIVLKLVSDELRATSPRLRR